MATNPKMHPCPTCGKTDHLGVFAYDYGWQHVECIECNYMGPGEGSKRMAIKGHNAFAPAIAKGEGSP
jgi:uncharacterized metal-binding protein (TIGR02443 family)